MPYTLTSEDERRLARVIRGDDPAAAIAARNQLVTANLPLVHKVLSRSIGLAYVSDLDDLIAEGSLGLLRAAQAWNPDQGGPPFVAYARTSIKHAMWKYLRRHRRLPCEVLADELADNAPPPAAVLATREEADRAFGLMQELHPVHRFVLLGHLGLVDGVPKTFGELAAEMDLPVKQTQDLYLAAMARFR